MESMTSKSRVLMGALKKKESEESIVCVCCVCVCMQENKRIRDKAKEIINEIKLFA